MIRYHGTAIIPAALLVALTYLVTDSTKVILVVFVLPSTRSTVRVWVDCPPGWGGQVMGCVCPAWVSYCTRTAEAGRKVLWEYMRPT